MKKAFGIFLLLCGTVGAVLFLLDGELTIERVVLGGVIAGILWDTGWTLIKNRPIAELKDKLFQWYVNTPDAKAEGYLDRLRKADKATRLKAVDSMLLSLLMYSVPEKGEEARMDTLLAKLDLTADDMSVRSRELFAKWMVIRDLMVGEITPRCPEKPLPFTLMESEMLVWAFAPMPVLQVQLVATTQRFKGEFATDLSTKRYWPLGGILARGTNCTLVRNLGELLVFVTDRRLVLYSMTGLEVMQIPYGKVFSLVPFKPGLVVHYEGTRDVSLLFRCGDPWFFLNVLQNVSQREA